MRCLFVYLYTKTVNELCVGIMPKVQTVLPALPVYCTYMSVYVRARVCVGACACVKNVFIIVDNEICIDFKDLRSKNRNVYFF